MPWNELGRCGLAIAIVAFLLIIVILPMGDGRSLSFRSAVEVRDLARNKQIAVYPVHGHNYATTVLSTTLSSEQLGERFKTTVLFQPKTCRGVVVILPFNADVPNGVPLRMWGKVIAVGDAEELVRVEEVLSR